MKQFLVVILCLYLTRSCQGVCLDSDISTHPDGFAKSGDGGNYHEACMVAIKGQIKMEFQAAMQYLLMGAYFSQDNVNLEGFSNFFFEHADEERGHGMAFMDYLRMRGDNSNDLFPEIVPILGKTTWTDGEDALRDALNMEKAVSKAIKTLIDTCDNDQNSDYHAADWLTGTWLEEQLAGQRKLAGMINNLNTFKREHEALADWMFSQQLLKA